MSADKIKEPKKMFKSSLKGVIKECSELGKRMLEGSLNDLGDKLEAELGKQYEYINTERDKLAKERKDSEEKEKMTKKSLEEWAQKLVKTESDLNAYENDLGSKSREIGAARKDLEARENKSMSELNAQKKNLDTREANLKQGEADLAKKWAELEMARNEIISSKCALEFRIEDLEDREASVNLRELELDGADQLKSEKKPAVWVSLEDFVKSVQGEDGARTSSEYLVKVAEVIKNTRGRVYVKVDTTPVVEVGVKETLASELKLLARDAEPDMGRCLRNLSRKLIYVIRGNHSDETASVLALQP